MDFITDNYIWFIVGGVVLIMTIIGYFADKTNFGKKALQDDNKEEKQKKSKNDKNIKKEEEQNSIVEQPVEIIEQPVENIKPIVPDESVESLNVPFSDDLIASDGEPEKISEVIETPLEPVSIEAADVIEQQPVKEVKETISSTPEPVGEPINDDDDDVWKF